MTVSAYKYMLYWLIYVCMYRLEYMYQCKLGKEAKNKMYLES
jgi:hypothetical protein